VIAASEQKKVYAHYKVRTSNQDRTLDSMFPVVNQATRLERSESAAQQSPTNQPKAKEIKESQCSLTSVTGLRQNLLKGKHKRKPQRFFTKGDQPDS
jgi:DNA mismatch repair protein MLH1